MFYFENFQKREFPKVQSHFIFMIRYVSSKKLFIFFALKKDNNNSSPLFCNFFVDYSCWTDFFLSSGLFK